MAKFCTSCGSPVAEDLTFCSQCGQPLAAPPLAAPSTPAEPASVAPAPLPAAAPAAPAKASSPILKIILIVVLLIVFILVASIGACVYLGYRAKKAVDEAIKLDEKGKSVEIQTPGGALKLGEQSTKPGDTIAGVPVYPGSSAVEGGAQFSFGDKFQIGGQEFVTDDSVDQVVAFYKENLGTELMMAEGDGHYRMSVNRGDKEHPLVVTVDVSKDEDTGKTRIIISHLGGEEKTQ